MLLVACLIGAFCSTVNFFIGHCFGYRKAVHDLSKKDIENGTSSGKAGQFFTPYHVSHLMAEVNFDKEKIKAEIDADPDRLITIAEPTCGAGGLIVAAIDVLKDAGVNYAWNVFVDCGDIDSRCVHMTYLTLSLLGVPAVVRKDMLFLCLLLTSKLKKLKKENRRLRMLFNGSRYGFPVEKEFKLRECTMSQTFEGWYNSLNHIRDFCDIITNEFMDVMKQKIKQPLFDAIFKNFVSEFKKSNNNYKCAKVVVNIPYVMFDEKNIEVKIYE